MLLFGMVSASAFHIHFRNKQRVHPHDDLPACSTCGVGAIPKPLPRPLPAVGHAHTFNAVLGQLITMELIISSPLLYGNGFSKHHPVVVFCVGSGSR
jgi:hypothetical protein